MVVSLAVWSALKVREVQLAGRFDPEHFRPEYVAASKVLDGIPTVSLRFLATVRGGFPWKSEHFVEDEGEPVVRIRDIKPGVVDPETLTGLDPEYIRGEIGGVSATKGELVIGMDGLDYFYGGYIPAKVWVNQRVAILTPKSAGYPAEYLLAAINSNVGQRQLLRKMTIAATVGHITNEDIRSLRVPVLQVRQRAQIAEAVASAIEARLLARQRITEASRDLNKIVMAA